MRLSIAAVAACLTCAQAFRDTSPFLLFSSSEIPQPLEELSRSPVQSAAHVIGAATSFLEGCKSNIYYLITQPSLSASDVTSDAFPTLATHLHDSVVKSKSLISNVQGLSDDTPAVLLDAIKSGCGENNIEIQDETAKWNVDGALKNGKMAVLVMKFDEFTLSTVREERDEQLRDNDARINNMLKTIVHGADYTVIYTSTPANATISQEIVSYQADFQNPVHIDLKRNLNTRVPPKTVQTDNRPLFETYQFLTPGLFMGLLVGLIMIAILSVGLSAISSLQVSYGAFDKEMGPAAQRKQQ